MHADDRTLHAWDVKTGSEIKEFPYPRDKGWVHSFSSDGQKLILFREKEVILWDIQGGKELGRYPYRNDFQSNLALIGDRLFMLSSMANRLACGTPRGRSDCGRSDDSGEELPGLPMAFSADGAIFAVEAPPRAISVFQSVTGKLLRRLEADVANIYWSLPSVQMLKLLPAATGTAPCIFEN